MGTQGASEGLGQPLALSRWVGAGLVALLMSTSISSSHAEPSNAELLKRIETLESQMNKMREADQLQAKALHRTKDQVLYLEKNRAAPREVRYVERNTTQSMPPSALPVFVTGGKHLQFGAITLSPGGFFAAESEYRSRAITADMATPYAAIPMQNSAYGHIGEGRFSARQSRVSLLAQAFITPSVLVSGYGEFDFLGAAATANQVETNSYNPRIRNLYGTLDFLDSGWHFLAGQNWTLATLNGKGITPRNELLAPTIDAYLVPGEVWARQPQLRLTKDFDKKIWLALSVEQPQTTFGTGCTAGAGATTIGAPAVTGVTGITCQENGNVFFNPTTAYSMNEFPDVIGKVAFEPTLFDRDVHLEFYGMYRDFYDRVAYTDGVNESHHTPGYGLAYGLEVPIIPKLLDFQTTGLFGRGIGRYGSTELPDATFASNGAVDPVKEGMLFGGFIAHPTPAIDTYLLGGVEREFPTYFQNGAIVSSGAPSGAASGFYGIGAPNINDSGCYIEGSSACTGNTKEVYQLTAGLWDRIYQGSYGEVRAGLQYSYTKRELFNSVYNNSPLSPSTDENVVMTSFRYYPFP
jgi:hypothetical protein